MTQKFDILFVCPCCHCDACCLYDISKVKFCFFEHKLPCLNLGQVQHIVYYIEKTVSRNLYHIHIFFLLVIEGSVCEKLCNTDNCVHRGADFMAHASQKFRLCKVGRLCFLFCLVQFFLNLPAHVHFFIQVIY